MNWDVQGETGTEERLSYERCVCTMRWPAPCPLYALMAVKHKLYNQGSASGESESASNHR